MASHVSRLFGDGSSIAFQLGTRMLAESFQTIIEYRLTRSEALDKAIEVRREGCRQHTFRHDV